MLNERRRYFRLEDTVMLHVSPVNPADLKAKLDDFWSDHSRSSDITHYNQRIEAQLSDLRSIRRKMPDLARCLEFLQEQIDQLTQQVLVQQLPQKMTKKKVSLSAQGLSYCTDNHLHSADIVELHLGLSPSNHQLLIYARVVWVKDSTTNIDQGRHQISFDFIHIHDADREILIRHVHNKQLQQLSESQGL